MDAIHELTTSGMFPPLASEIRHVIAPREAMARKRDDKPEHGHKERAGLRRYLARDLPLRLRHQGVEIEIWRDKKGAVRIVAPPEVEIVKNNLA